MSAIENSVKNLKFCKKSKILQKIQNSAKN